MRLPSPLFRWFVVALSVSLGAGFVAPLAPAGTVLAQTEGAKPTGPRQEPAMVLVPGGTFLMGKEGYDDASPRHEVRLSPFYLDRCEVTNAQYQEFCEATARKLPFFWGMKEFRSGPDFPNHPVVGVSYYDARAFARWRSARLPTEAEWEYAARGGLVGKEFSHGDELDPLLYAETGEGPSPVGSFPANGFGLHDMIGNVCEWVYDWYDAGYYASSPVENPPGPGNGRFRVFRGGGWFTGPSCSKVYYRNALPGNWVDFNVGFRCARYVGESAAGRIGSALDGKEGFDAARARFREMRAAEAGKYYFDETEFNDLGYRLLGANRVEDAMVVLGFNVELFPRSFNAWDSLGEVHRKHGDRLLAMEYYRRALELNPAGATSRKALEEMEAE